jgi:VRR-NUC domain
MSTTVFKQSESHFQAAVVELAERLGWRVSHFNDSRREVVDRRSGERKLVGDKSAKGFPDLVMARAPRLVIAELKAEKGKLSSSQEEWLEDLRAIPGVEVYVWYPYAWDVVERVLR